MLAGDINNFFPNGDNATGTTRLVVNATVKPNAIAAVQLAYTAWDPPTQEQRGVLVHPALSRLTVKPYIELIPGSPSKAPDAPAAGGRKDRMRIPRIIHQFYDKGNEVFLQQSVRPKSYFHKEWAESCKVNCGRACCGPIAEGLQHQHAGRCKSLSFQLWLVVLSKRSGM
jgi:hypothetical protein